MDSSSTLRIRQAKGLLMGMAAILALAGCASLSRSRSSGYAADPVPHQSRDRRSIERDSAAGDLGYDRSDLSDSEAGAVEMRIALNKAEKALEGRREREQYFKNKPYFHNDRERLEFLRLDSFEERAHWLNMHGVQASQHPPAVQAIIDMNDIAIGMTKQAVRDSWGEPELIEVAGNPMYGNERWHYSEQTSSAEGYRTQSRVVYFESGRVSGWESR